MFYLLEDNRIIKNSEKFSHIFCYENRKGLLYKVFSDKNYGKNRKIGKIKKQSENVFDLIENGDLLKYKDRFDKKVYVEIVKEVIVELKLIRATPNVIKYDEIVSFYKPNSNGDYVKVWETKNE